MKKFNWNRLRNRGFLLSVASFVSLMAKQYGLFEVPENWDTMVDLGLSMLSMLGFVNDPTTENKWYGDDK